MRDSGLSLADIARAAEPDLAEHRCGMLAEQRSRHAHRGDIAAGFQFAPTKGSVMWGSCVAIGVLRILSHRIRGAW